MRAGVGAGLIGASKHKQEIESVLRVVDLGSRGRQDPKSRRIVAGEV